MADELVKVSPSDSSAGYLADKIDNATLEVNFSLQKLRVKDGGITNLKLANNSVTASKIANSSVSNDKLADPTLKALAELFPQKGKAIIGNGLTWVLGDTATVVRANFTDANLDYNGSLLFPHGIANEFVGIFIYNDKKTLVIPEVILKPNGVAIELTEFRPLVGTWTMVVIG